MSTESITQKRLKELLHYDPETGVFIWLARSSAASRVKIGSEARCLTSKGYIWIMIDGRRYYAHRLAFLYMTGKFPVDQTDHDNHIRHDNRWDNLNEATNTTNHKNQSMPRNNSSGRMGVRWRKDIGKWHAQIRVDYKLIHLGYFINIDDAIKARQAANIKYSFHQNHGLSLAM